MLALLLALAAHASPFAAPNLHDPVLDVALAASHRSGVALPSDATKALDAWLKLYFAGKISILSKENIASKSLAMKFDLVPKSGLGNPTWEGDLHAILEAVAKQDDAEAATALLEVAAVGLTASKLDADAAPHHVRAAGEKWAARLTSAAAKEELAKAARGESKGDKAAVAGLQIAGVRCLARLGDKAMRATIEQQLNDGDELVRVNAAEALQTLGDEAAAMALIGSLERETSDAVLIAVSRCLRSLYSPYVPTPATAKSDETKTDDASAGVAKAAPAKKATGAPPESTRLAARAAIGAIGRSTWRGDMALLQLLDDWRSLEAIPALIGVLERFRDNPQDVQSGKLSQLLLYRAHELLSAMTGAVIPAQAPEKWRELWEREKDKIDLNQKHEPKGPPTTVASGFCGIPVQGSRVLFILDLSGSMDFPMPDGQTKRIDFARRELERAMTSISPDAHFNLVTFNGNPKAKMWSKEMVPATERNRARFLKHVEGLRANGGTNLWSGFEQGLKVRSLVYGDRYETNVDEVFILSDGAPSVGDIIDPIEILRLVHETNRFANMRINTIFITSTNPQEAQPMPWMTISPAELMRRLANENGGKFIGL